MSIPFHRKVALIASYGFYEADILGTVFEKAKVSFQYITFTIVFSKISDTEYLFPPRSSVYFYRKVDVRCVQTLTAIASLKQRLSFQRCNTREMVKLHDF